MIEEPVYLSSKGFAEYRQRNREPDKVFAERIGRLILAGAASRRLHPNENFTLGNGTVRTARHTKNNARWVDVDDWQDRRGFTETYDESKELSTLKRGNLTIVIPLAAKKIKVNGVWRDLPDIVSKRDGRWFVPLQTLEDAL